MAIDIVDFPIKKMPCSIAMLNYQRVPSIIKNKPVVKGVLSNPSLLINQWAEGDIYVTWGDGNFRIQLMELHRVSTI